MTDQSTVLIIGASRGLGLGLAKTYLERGYRVVATVRGETGTALHDLVSDRLEIERVDITRDDEMQGLRDRLAGRQFDVLFVNAGVTNDPYATSGDVQIEEFVRLMVTNALSPMRTVEKLGDLVTAQGTIAVMSSRQGSISENTQAGFEIYRASKSALNQLMRSYSARNPDDPRTLILMAPGWVKTDLGGDYAPLTVAESVPKVVDTLEANTGHGGLQFLSYLGEKLPW